jgi:uncharacterized protein (DUF1684 family)
VNYREEILAFRRAKDDFFRTSHDSPIPEEERRRFKGLKYFEPDEAFRVRARLVRYPKPEVLTMLTSKGTVQRFARVGYFEFELEGKKVRLQAYKSAEGNDTHLFVPFRDKTSGNETYGAGRYLDLDVSPDDRYTIDFNLAYNPYCAYSGDYICPLPPRENWLPVEVRAGEKKYHD